MARDAGRANLVGVMEERMLSNEKGDEGGSGNSCM